MHFKLPTEHKEKFPFSLKILSQAVEIAWLVIESVPERLELKKLVFEELSKLQQQIAFWVLIRPLLNRASCWKIWMPQLDVGV